MATPVVVVPAGGLPVTEALSPYGWPMIESPNGLGLPVTFSTGGIPVAGISAFIPGSPVNTVAPVISGTTTIGQVLSCTTGTWSPTATSYAYFWRRNGSLIAGATASTYTLVAADNAAAMTCRVVGTNAIGPSLAVISNTLTLADVTPVNSVAPAITGTATVGSVLTVTNGTWSNSPSFTRAWRRGGVAIGSATATTYTLVAADNIAVIDCVVTAINAAAIAVTANSNSVTVAEARPINSVAPVVTGTATVGQVLSCSTGTWSNTPSSYAYQWTRTGVDISGATSATYLLVTADNTTSVLCRVTASNAIGATPTPVNSNAMTIGAAGTTTVTASNGQWWKFTGTVENGLYIDGSPWVKTATTVELIEVSAAPTGTGVTARNGGMINPTFNTLAETSPFGNSVTTGMKQGFDGRANDGVVLAYDESYNAQATLPRTLAPGDSLVSCESFLPLLTYAELPDTSNKRAITKMAVVTVVSTTPAADAFRPNYFGTSKANWTVSGLNLALLPDVTAPFNPKSTSSDGFHLDSSSIYAGASGDPYVTTTQQMRTQSLMDLQWWIVPIQGVNSNSLLKPLHQQYWYPGGIGGTGHSYGKISSYVMCDFSDRDVFVKRIVQVGIDCYAIAAGFSGRSPWSTGAGFAASPLWLIRFAGLLLNHTGMKNATTIATGKTDYESNVVSKWGENCICYHSGAAHAQYLRVSGEAYAGGFPLYGDHAFQDLSTGMLSSNSSARDPDGEYDAFDYVLGLPTGSYPDILDDTYDVWPISGGNFGNYLSIMFPSVVGNAMASMLMGDEAFWGGAYIDFVKRVANDPQMWSGWGINFDYDNAFGSGNAYQRDFYARGGSGNGWMDEMWDIANPAVVAPTVSSFSPLDNATGVAIADNLTVTFNMNVQFGTGNISLYKTDDTLVEAFNVATEVGTGPGQVSIAGAVLTINPTASLLNSTGYYVQIAATAIESTADVAFAGILDETTWSFTTVASVSGAWLNVWDWHATTLTIEDNGWTGYTLVLTVPMLEFVVPTSTQIRLTIKGGATEGTILGALWVGNGGGAEAWDFTGDQAQMLQSAGTTITAGAGATIVTDAVNFVKDATNPLVFAWHFTGATGDNLYRSSIGGGGVGSQNYYKATAADAATQNKTGYTSAGGGPHMFSKIEFFTTAYGEQSAGLPEGEASASGLTFADRTFALDNNATITKLGTRSAVGGACKVMILKRVSAGTYDVMASESFTHPGGGWAVKTLTTPYVVPSTGTFHAALYAAGGGPLWEIRTAARAYYSGEASGTGVAFTEDSSNCLYLRASGTL